MSDQGEPARRLGAPGGDAHDHDSAQSQTGPQPATGGGAGWDAGTPAAGGPYPEATEPVTSGPGSRPTAKGRSRLGGFRSSGPADAEGGGFFGTAPRSYGNAQLDGAYESTGYGATEPSAPPGNAQMGGAYEGAGYSAAEPLGYADDRTASAAPETGRRAGGAGSGAYGDAPQDGGAPSLYGSDRAGSGGAGAGNTQAGDASYGGATEAGPPPGSPVWESAEFDAAFDAAFQGTSATAPGGDGGGSDAFDDFESGGGYSNYAGVDMSGPGGPVKAGVPSSGNWQMPDWMREEAPDGGFLVADGQRGGKGKVMLLAGVGVLVAALIAAGVVYVMQSGGGKSDVKPTGKPKGAASSGSGKSPKTQQQSSAAAPADAKLAKFPGAHTKVAGRINDTFTGLNYPKFATPWQVPSKKSGMAQLGWSAQQILVTEKHAGQIWYGQLMSGLLSPAEQDIYAGPGSEKAAAVAYEKSTEARLYSFTHKSKPLASQAIDLPGAGGKGWLVSTALTYHRDGIKATGEILTVAIVDTGKSTPAVLFMSVPDTHKKLYPDINLVVDSLKRAT